MSQESGNDRLLCLLDSEDREKCIHAAILLVRERPDYLSDNPHLAYRLAALAQRPANNDLRYELIVLLASLPEKKQHFQLQLCPDRDEVATFLKQEGETGALLSFLKVSFYRWQPEMDEPEDLKWLLKVLKACLKGAGSERAKMTLGSGEAKQLFQSRALLEALIDEAYEAAAECIVRCLRGPGGDHRLEEMENHLSDPPLGNKVLEILSRSPGAFALLLEDGMPKWCRKAEPPEDLALKICMGIRAADQALSELVQEYLDHTSNEEDEVKECNGLLEPVKVRLKPYME